MPYITELFAEETVRAVTASNPVMPIGALYYGYVTRKFGLQIFFQHFYQITTHDEAWRPRLRRLLYVKGIG